MTSGPATDAPTVPAQRVLLVDDTSAMRYALRHLLESEGGWEVVGEACNGAEAGRLAEGLAPDVIVLNHQMPILTGLDALPSLRRSCPRARIVMWTGSQSVRRQALALGADAVVDRAQPVDQLVRALTSPPAGHPPV